MRRFLASAWYPFCVCVDLAIATAVAFAVLNPTGADIGNGKIQRIVTMAAWAVGPVFAVLSFLLIGILNLLRRLFRIRKSAWLHPLIVLAGIAPSLVFSWVLMDEPRYTPIARAIIDFGARELLWGTLVASLIAIIIGFPAFLPQKKR
jgi:hypothetical protein